MIYMHRPIHLFIVLFLALASSLASSLPAYGQSSMSFIRDGELEETLRLMAAPIFKQAGLAEENVNIFIVGSDDINAFVAGGQNVFIFTGLIKGMDEPGMLLAVIAHETGHIAGGHLARGTEQLKNAQIGSVLGLVLGVAAAAAGAPDAGMAVMSGGSHLLTRNLLSFTRSNEQSADQAALGYLDALGISTEGMVKTFELLSRKQRNQLGDVDPYAITHPLSSERVNHARNHLEHSPIPAGAFPKELAEPYARLVAKLYAFTEPANKTFQKYPMSDDSVAANMARAVAWHKQARTKQALDTMKTLIAAHPRDAFLYDLQGQILFESSQIEAAKNAYELANQLKPDHPLLLTSLAETYLALGKPYTNRAIDLLEKATSKERTNANSFRLLAVAYGRQGNLGLSHMALAEEAALRGDADAMDDNLDRALTVLPKTSPSRIRAEDLRRVSEEIHDNE